MPHQPSIKHAKPLIAVQKQSRRPKSYQTLVHAMSATRRNLAALVDEQDKSQESQANSLRVAEIDMPSANDSKVLVRMLARPVNPSGQSSNGFEHSETRCMISSTI